MHVKDVPENEDKRDHTGPTLQHVTIIAGGRIAARVGHSTLHNHHADDSVKDQRQKDERPLNKRQCRTKRMDLIDKPLELL